MGIKVEAKHTLDIRLIVLDLPKRVRVCYRGTRKDGELVQASVFFDMTITTGVEFFLIPLFEGTLEAVTVSSTTDSQFGRAFAVINILAGSSIANSIVLNKLISNYFTDRITANFPAQTLILPNGILPAFRAETPPPPALGIQWSRDMSNVEQWRINSIGFRFTADGTAINRFVAIQVRDATSVIFNAVATTAVTAGQTIDFSFASTLQQSSAGGITNAPFPNHYTVPRLATIGTITSNMQAGDLISNIRVNALITVTNL